MLFGNATAWDRCKKTIKTWYLSCGHLDFYLWFPGIIIHPRIHQKVKCKQSSKHFLCCFCAHHSLLRLLWIQEFCFHWSYSCSSVPVCVISLSLFCTVLCSPLFVCFVLIHHQIILNCNLSLIVLQVRSLKEKKQYKSLWAKEVYCKRWGMQVLKY